METETAIVMEASTGTILYEKNIHMERYPASITKIMTALLAVENSSLEEEVVFSKDAVFKTEGSGIARDVGEVMTMEECLYGMMLQSANECAYAIAEHVGGDYDGFIQMMNQKAEELGCRNTHFNNPNGLPDEKHYTTVYDMALISRAALKNKTFCKIAGTKTYTIPPTNKHKEETYLTNDHKMLNEHKGPEYLYQGCIGGKTGYTSAARNTLVTFARRNEMTLICVVLNEKATKQYLDTAALLDDCFENFQIWNVAEHEKEEALDEFQNQFSSKDKEDHALILDSDGWILLPKGVDFTEASREILEGTEEGNPAGVFAYTYAGRKVGEADILIDRGVEAQNHAGKISVIPAKEEQMQKGRKAGIRKIFQIILGLAVLLGIGAGMFYFRNGSSYFRWMKARRDRPRRIK
ncbi:MAG: D-alanyl-D-alanine carboxypeptidase [Lachnospiraceae bacterium]|nr:D-alanyl-D-alanine carboxypeptidase [Lachnospiraceae bacterium]